MRATKGPTHKALVPVLGIPMLERNLRTLFSHGFLDVTIAVAAGQDAIEGFVKTRGQELASAAGASVAVFQERVPLGTIGAAGEFAKSDRPLMIVNVDNLSGIDLRAMLDAHVKSLAAMTVAVHRERFSIPFGEVVVEDGFLVDYREKPERRLLISSGTYVLSPAACGLLERNRPTAVPELVRSLNEHGLRVAAYEHDAPWIDVNDATAVDKAETLIAQRPDAFKWGD